VRPNNSAPASTQMWPRKLWIKLVTRKRGFLRSANKQNPSAVSSAPAQPERKHRFKPEPFLSPPVDEDFGFGGKQHPKDVIRRSRPRSKKGRAKPWKQKVFDSTLGYPGEGPPKGSVERKRKPKTPKRVKNAKSQMQLCGNCNRYGHLAVECKVVFPDIPEIVNISATQLVQELEEKDGKHDAEEPKVTKTKEVEVKTKTAGQIITRLRALASTALMQKNLDDQRDLRIVRGTLNQHALSNDLETLVDNVSQEIETILNDSLKMVMELRHQSARERSTRWVEPDQAVEYANTWNPFQPVEAGIDSLNPVDLIKYYEGVSPQSLIDMKQSTWDVYFDTVHKNVRYFVAFEECIKMILTFLFNYYIRGYCPGQDIYLSFGISLLGAVFLYSAYEFMSPKMVGSGYTFLQRYCLHLYCTIPLLGWKFHYDHNKNIMLYPATHGVANLLNLFASMNVTRLRGTAINDICLFEYMYKHVDVIPHEWKCTKQVCEPKFGARASWHVDGFVPIVYRACHHNEKVSTDGRVFKAVPVTEEVCKENVFQHWKQVTRACWPKLSTLIKNVRNPMDYEQWCSRFPPEKREYFLKFMENSYVIPRGTPASAFIKRELALKKYEGIETNIMKDPRWIQGCPRELTAAVGPTVVKFTKHVHDGLAPRTLNSVFSVDDVKAGRQVIYTCGMSNEAIGTAFGTAIATLSDLSTHDNRMIFIEDDQSRFDLHMRKGPFYFLDRVYRDKIPRCAKLLKRSERLTGRSKLGVKYRIDYTMQSGWPDTSVGDTLTNTIMKHHIHGTGRPWISIIMGDDSVTITLESELKRIGGVDGLMKAYESFGMEVTAKTSTNPLSVEYCSSVFMPKGYLANGSPDYLLFPYIGKVISRLGWDMVDRTPKQSRRWVLAIADTLAQIGIYDPPCAALAKNIRTKYGDVKKLTLRNNEYDKYFDGTKALEPDGIYFYYHHHYGLNAKDVDDLASHLETVDLGCLKHPHLVHMANSLFN